MKKTAFLIMAAMLLLVACGKDGHNPDKLKLSEYAFKARIADVASATKASPVGNGSDGMDITLTAYDEKNGVVGDNLYVLGLVGDISEIYDRDATYYACYHVVKVSNGIAILDLAQDPDNELDRYDECEYFLITSLYDGNCYADEHGNVQGGPFIANTCSKEEMDGIMGGEEVLDLYVLNSTVRVKLDVSGNDAPLTIQYVTVDTDTWTFTDYVDYRRVDDMIRDKTFYAHPEGFLSWAAEVYSNGVIPAGGGSCYLYYSIIPRTISNVKYSLSLMDDQNCEYEILVVDADVIDAKIGKVYDTEISISKGQLESARHFIPHIIADGNKFVMTDTGYGMDNAQMIGDLLKTKPWVYIQKAGEPADYSGIDVNGKVVLVDRGVISFSSKVLNASAAGAVGIIVVNNQEGTVPMDLTDIQGHPDRIPAVSSTKELGEYLLEHPGASLSLKYTL